MNWLVWGCAVLALVGSATNVHAAGDSAEASPSAEVVREAVRLGHEGRELFDAARFADAFAKFSAAEELAHSPVFTLHMARCLRGMNRLLEARPLYERTSEQPLAESAPPAWLAARAEATSELAELRRDVPVLTFEILGASPHDVRISVGSSVVEQVTEPFEVDPGRHVILATAGAQRLQRAVALEPGTRSNLELDFRSAPEPEQHSAVSASPPESPSPAPRVGPDSGTNLWLWSSFGVAAIAAATGAVTYGMAWRQQAELDCDPDGSCARGDEDDKRSIQTLADLATVSAVVAGVATVAGVTIWLVDDGDSGAEVMLNLRPCGVDLSGAF